MVLRGYEYMNILLMGKPGCGKGTLANALIQEGWLHLSTGNLMREKMRNDDPMAQELKLLLNQGKFATDEMTIEIVQQYLAKIGSSENVLFDGFPRTIPQSHWLKENYKIDLVVYLEISDQTLTERITNRRVHPQSGRIYNTLFNPPKIEGIDDETGEPLITRKDDTAEVIAQRLKEFETLTAPAYRVLKEAGIPVLEINAQQHSQAIKQEVLNYIAQLKVNPKMLKYI